LNDPLLIAVGASLGDAPVGLAFAAGTPLGPETRLLSLYVNPWFRKRGIGTELLRVVEREVRAVRSGRFFYRRTVEIDDNNDAALRFAEGRGWSNQKLYGLVAALHMERILEMPFVRDAQPLERSVVKSWREISEAEHAYLEREVEPETSHVPRSMRPLGFDEQIDLDLSTLLVRDGQVLAWNLVEPYGDNAIRWPVTYAERSVQHLGALWVLWRSSAERQLRRRPDQPIMTFLAASPMMIRFTERRLRPYLEWMRRSVEVEQG
jgi:hypothetical protein